MMFFDVFQHVDPRSVFQAKIECHDIGQQLIDTPDRIQLINRITGDRNTGNIGQHGLQALAHDL